LYIYPRRNQRRIPILIGLAAFACTACVLLSAILVGQPDQLLAALNLVKGSTPTATEDPTPEVTVETSPTATDTPIPSATNTRRPTTTRTPTRTPRPSPTLMPTDTPISVMQHFILGRPVPPNAAGIVPSWVYLYGTTEHGNLEVHHGEEFVNPIGTPLIAPADGVVVVAGNDSKPRCGDDGTAVCGDYPNFYGNLVVVKLDQTFNNQAVFTMCGHMNTVGVAVGQHVNAGDQIGTVGQTGIALGPHCHFEVRLGVNDYAHTRNPILWMKPLPGRGSVVGIVQDRNGNLLRGVNVFLYADNATQDYLQDTETYGRDDQPPVNSDDELRENWAMGDLRVGNYVVRVQLGGLNYVRHIAIQDGRLLFIVIGGN
jgi:murein DD-endopeptidase MepM/ murein hydrolase activator NlpD